MSARQQYRIVYSSVRGGSRGACFVDAADETSARAFFAQAFPNSAVVEIVLEPVDPCAAYERKDEPAVQTPGQEVGRAE